MQLSLKISVMLQPMNDTQPSKVEVVSGIVTAPPEAWRRVADFIDFTLTQKGWTQAQVQEAADVSAPTMKSLRNAESTSYRLETVQRVLGVLNFQYKFVVPFLKGEVPQEALKSYPRTMPDQPVPVRRGPKPTGVQRHDGMRDDPEEWAAEEFAQAAGALAKDMSPEERDMALHLLRSLRDRGLERRNRQE